MGLRILAWRPNPSLTAWRPNPNNPHDSNMRTAITKPDIARALTLRYNL